MAGNKGFAMEFSENGAVSNPADEATSDYQPSKPGSDKGYPEGPRSAMGLFNAMRLSLIAYIVIEAVWRAILFLYLLVPGILPDFMYAPADADFTPVVLIGLVYLGITIIAFFFTCRFTYRTMRNLHTINSPAAEISPVWAVGSYFVPFINLAVPAMAMSQIYHGTHEAVGEKSRDASPIPVWWTCWLLSNIPEAIAERLTLEPLMAFGLYLASGVLGVIAATSLIRMGQRIAERQELLKHGGVANVFA